MVDPRVNDDCKQMLSSLTVWPQTLGHLCLTADTQQQSTQAGLETETWSAVQVGAWPAEDPGGSPKGPEQGLSVQTFATSSKMLDTLFLSFLYLVEDGTREEGEMNNLYNKKSWGSSPKCNSQKYLKCLKKKKKGTVTKEAAQRLFLLILTVIS